jgi:prephenate dehydrogenase
MSATDSTIFHPRRAAVLGIGLLGGSVGLALRQVWPQIEIAAWGRTTETTELAVKLGAATSSAASLVDACSDADLVIVATPVDWIARHVIEAAQVCRTTAIITDVGSTKCAIVRRVESDRLASKLFVGSHPIAGGDKTGPEHSRHDLFHERTVVVTPTNETDPRRTEMVLQMWRSLGATVRLTGPDEHDQLLAATSHLPHLVASSLASILPPEAVPFVGTGWRDTTRIAAGSPQMWSAICNENSAAIADQLQSMIDALERLKAAVSGRDTGEIEHCLQQGRINRLKCESSS